MSMPWSGGYCEQFFCSVSVGAAVETAGMARQALTTTVTTATDIFMRMGTPFEVRPPCGRIARLTCTGVREVPPTHPARTGERARTRSVRVPRISD
jgi:hypothetical protein